VAFQSGGVVVKDTHTLWRGTPATWNNIPLSNRFASYGEIYRQHLWVFVVVNKLAKGLARLPLKVYERDELNRPEAPEHPYARLLRRPNSKHSAFFFWMWASSTFDTYGEFFWAKQRDAGGRPTALLPLHPTSMYEEEERNGEVVWRFQNANLRIDNIRDSDLVHPRTFNPDSVMRGMSPLEPLRRTLEFEDAAQRAQSSFWRKGARPGVALRHPSNISTAAADRLRLQWDQVAAGADNYGTTVILEEGMEPAVLSLSAEEAQYIESRKLNREEVCGAYDVPPPVVHILDRATFSNITEQMRSMYRDTMAPRLKWFESELHMQLRDSVRPGASEPDFGDDVYSEFLLDEVLRGDFEARADAYQKADYMTLAEKRRAENLPYIEGTDRIFVNSATIPLEVAGQTTGGIPEPMPEDDDDEPVADNVVPMRRGIDETELRTLMGRLSRPESLSDVDGDRLVSGLKGHASLVLAELNASKAVGESVAQFRARLKSLGG
jgi:HK97 family phage portal protein